MNKLILFGSEDALADWISAHTLEYVEWGKSKYWFRHPDGRQIRLVVADHGGCEDRFRGCTFTDLEVFGPWSHQLSKAVEDARYCVHTCA